MAIDTAAKRKSCIGIGMASLRAGVIPDGSDLSAPQRLHSDFLYSGIAASAPGGVTLLAMERATWRNMTGGTWRRMG
jgi:hypothetical protein